ncbi:MAG: hypothetical protein AAB573_00330 [Patescibacteria group bacterium]
MPSPAEHGPIIAEKVIELDRLIDEVNGESPVQPKREVVQPVPVPAPVRAPLSKKDRLRKEYSDAEQRMAGRGNRYMIFFYGAPLPAVLTASLVGWWGGSFALLTPVGWILWGVVAAAAVAAAIRYLTLERWH